MASTSKGPALARMPTSSPTWPAGAGRWWSGQGVQVLALASRSPGLQVVPWCSTRIGGAHRGLAGWSGALPAWALVVRAGRPGAGGGAGQQITGPAGGAVVLCQAERWPGWPLLVRASRCWRWPLGMVWRSTRLNRGRERLARRRTRRGHRLRHSGVFPHRKPFAISTCRAGAAGGPGFGAGQGVRLFQAVPIRSRPGTSSLFRFCKYLAISGSGRWPLVGCAGVAVAVCWRHVSAMFGPLPPHDCLHGSNRYRVLEGQFIGV